MTRVPCDDADRLEALRVVAGRLAGTLRRHLLVAAHASLRAVREMLGSLTAGAHEPASAEHAARESTPAPPTPPPAPSRTAAVPPPPVELLHDDTPLPESYGTDRVVLLARDPHCLYAYWDLSPAHVERMRAAAGSGALRVVLRTYDATAIAFDATPPARFQDFAVAGNARSLYAYVGKPASCFVAEVGFLRDDGVFFPLARSAPVWTPRTEQPGTAPGRWMTVGWRAPRAGDTAPHAGELLPGGAKAAPAGDVVVAEARGVTRQAPSSWPGPAAPGAQRGSWSLVRGRRADSHDLAS